MFFHFSPSQLRVQPELGKVRPYLWSTTVNSIRHQRRQVNLTNRNRCGGTGATLFVQRRGLARRRIAGRAPRRPAHPRLRHRRGRRALRLGAAVRRPGHGPEGQSRGPPRRFPRLDRRRAAAAAPGAPSGGAAGARDRGAPALRPRVDRGGGPRRAGARPAGRSVAPRGSRRIWGARRRASRLLRASTPRTCMLPKKNEMASRPETTQ
jgi:hypothetical protein